MPSRSVRIIERLGFIAIGAAIFMVVSIGIYTLYENSKWDPLGDYPIQLVTQQPTIGGVPVESTTTVVESSDNSTSSGVSFYLDDDIHSSGVKCVQDGEGVVLIKGTLSWESDRPPGRIIKVADGSGERGPGCQLYDFVNPIPDVILEEIEELSQKGYTSSDWHLTGTEIPIRDNGEEGVSRTWITTSFTIIHKNRPTP